VFEQKTADGALVFSETIDGGGDRSSGRIVMRLLPDDRMLCEWRPAMDAPTTVVAVLERKRAQ
jgi:hypothetical protein